MTPRRPGRAGIGMALTLLIPLLLCALEAQAGPPAITWTPLGIEQTIGNGLGATRDASVTFVSDRTLSNVDLWITPEVRPFLQLEPAHLDTVTAGVPYTLRVHFSVPAQSPPGTYDGTVHVRVGSRTIPQTLKVTIDVDYGEVSIPPTTHVLSESTARYLTSIAPDSLVFSDVTPELQQLSPGDVVVIGVSSTTPNGLLRKVAGVGFGGGPVMIETTRATLEDALERGSIQLSEVVRPADVAAAVASTRGVALEKAAEGARGPRALEGFYLEIDDVVLYDFDGDPDTSNDRIKAKGSLAIDPRFDFDLAIQDARLTRVSFVNTTTQTAQLEITADVELLGAEKKIELARYYLSPVTVWVGWVPVVIEPVLTANLGLDGQVSAGITTSFTEQAVAKAGLAYDNGSWSPISDLSITFDYSPPTLSAGCDVKGYAGPQLSLLIYGVVGPYADLKGYLKLEADLFSTPWWEMYGGLEVGTGVRVEILGNQITDYYDPLVIGYRRLLAQATTPAPIQGSISGSVKDAVTGGPLEAVTVRVFKGALSVGSSATNASGTYRVDTLAGVGYVVEFSKAGYLTARYHDVAVNRAQTTFLEAVLQIDVAHSGPGNVSGRILNALSGAGVGGLQVLLREGINVTAGPVVASTTSAGDGSYSFASLEAGHYTGEAGGAGYTTTYFTVVCIGGTTTGNQNATITPILAPGETRIVLTWGATPRDLDSHLTGPLPDGTRFHMAYWYAGSSSPWPNYVTLDLDDTSGYGPETTTILQQIDGLYRFSVHDYTNRGSSTSAQLSASGAQVRVYRGSDLVASFNVPPDQGGTLWTVFELSGNVITPVNVLSFESNPSNIRRPSGIPTLTNLDGWPLRDLPSKRDLRSWRKLVGTN